MKSKEGAIRFYLLLWLNSAIKYDFEKEYFEYDYNNFAPIILK